MKCRLYKAITNVGYLNITNHRFSLTVCFLLPGHRVRSQGKLTLDGTPQKRGILPPSHWALRTMLEKWIIKYQYEWYKKQTVKWGTTYSPPLIVGHKRTALTQVRIITKHVYTNYRWPLPKQEDPKQHLSSLTK